LTLPGCKPTNAWDIMGLVRPVWLVQSPEAALALAEEELAKAKQATMDGLNGRHV